METSALPRRDRERLARRRAMLDAAVAVFAEKGYAAATVDEIAERAEFGKGTLYNYFADKHALLLAIFDEAVEELVAEIEGFFAREASAPERPARAVFRDFLAHVLAHYSARVPVFLVMVKEGHRLMFDADPAHVAYLHELHGRVGAALEGPIQAAMDRGALRPLDARAVAHMVMGNVEGYLMHASDLCGALTSPRAPRRSIEEGADLLATILFDGLCAERA